MSLYIHEKTKQVLTSIWSSSAHGILLSGPTGVGLKTVAGHLANESGALILWVQPEKDGAVDHDKGIISIAQIRQLYEMLKTKNEKGRTVIVDASEKMAEPAQNAFLKLLEEPPVGVRFVLLSHSPQSLLPTVRSRVQTVDVYPVTTAQSEALLDDLDVTDATKRAQLLFIAAGLPAEICRLASDDALFASRAGVMRDARVFLQGAHYERLLIAHAYRDSKDNALQLITYALKQLRLSIAKAGDPILIGRIDRLHEAYDTIKQNGNVRLQLAATLVV